MPHAITELTPRLLWKHFYNLTQVPRPSKKEEKVLAWLKELISGMGYTWEQDATGNIIVRKPATPGCEKAPTVLLQGHVDMVCEKNKGTEHDFDNDPLNPFVEGDWVRATGTTLGADNGIGVAAALAALESEDFVHGPLEFLFTVDEETGLTGAKGLEPNVLRSTVMLNLDSEEDGVLYVGCSGGMDSAGVMKLSMEAAPAGTVAFDILVGGLKGGHSGLEIQQGRGNAIQFLTRILLRLREKTALRVACISGGSKRNAIPREAECTVRVPEADAALVQTLCTEITAVFLNEIGTVEPGLSITVLPSEDSAPVVADAQVETLLTTLVALPHGVLKMSADIPGLVETSTNLATVTMENGAITIGTSQRSSVESEKMVAVEQVCAVFRLAGLELLKGDGYPGWKPNMQSEVLKQTKEAHNTLFGAYPEVKAIHAGLECGLIGEVYPKMDMISFGPTIEGVHSPDERLHIPTTEKFWRLLVQVLENIAKEQ